MKSETVLGIYRERIFSPGKVEDDAAILNATLQDLSALGWKVKTLQGEAITASTPRPKYVLSMAQSDRVLNILQEWSLQQTRIINSVESIRNCYRKPLIKLLMGADIPIPASRIVPLEDAYRNGSSLLPEQLWLKRGDVHAIQAGDVVPVHSKEELAEALEHFRNQLVQDVLLQQHVEGPVVKFYGVAQGEFFKAYLAETGEDITLRVQQLHTLARQAARLVGLEVYGGDAVLSKANGPVLIDLNDWPSFSRCFRPAAKSIAAYVSRRAGGI